MTVDRGLRPPRMSWSIWRDTPNAFATAVTDRPVDGRMSSLIISPGWMGGSPFFLSMASSLMVVFKIDIQRVFTRPAEGNPAVPSHPHRPAWRFALQALVGKSRDIHILGVPRYVQQLQDAHAFPDIGGADPACRAGAVNLFKPFMPEAAAHSLSVNVLDYSVN